MNKTFLLIIMGFFLISFISAISLPHAFYGTVKYSNGKNVEGTITAKINDLIVGSSDIIEGSYDLIAESESGGLIYFYLDDEVVGTFTFKSFEITELNLIIEQEQKEESKTSGKTSSFSQSSCVPNWECSGWSECDGESIARNCYDTNNCLYSYGKPIEKIDCEAESIEIGNREQTAFSLKSLNKSPLLASLIILAGIIFLLLIFGRR